jgi:hypothetical protein
LKFLHLYIASIQSHYNLGKTLVLFEGDKIVNRPPLISNDESVSEDRMKVII